MSALVALTVAGSDPSGGAGVQADLKTFSALGAYGCAVLTALTAQNTRGVGGVHVVPAGFVAEQLRTLLADVHVDAIKIGMLARADVARTVTDAVRELTGVPVVLDPVMVATSGHRLLDEDAVAAVRELARHAALITPNLAEAGVLLGEPAATDVATMREHAARLVDAGARRVLLKGGHLTGTEAVDVFADGDVLHELSAPRVPTRNTHGTGCTLSSAIAALRPQRGDWVDAVADAKAYLTRALAAADGLDVGGGAGPVQHFVDWWR